jgi:hypothetical protein
MPSCIAACNGFAVHHERQVYLQTLVSFQTADIRNGRSRKPNPIIFDYVKICRISKKREQYHGLKCRWWFQCIVPVSTSSWGFANHIKQVQFY